jgi:hypothetical protein
LDKAGAEVDVELYKWRITNRLKAVDLAGLDDKDVSSAALEGVAVYCPHPAAFTNELDLVVRMPVRARPLTGLALKQKHRNARVALLSPDELVRTTNKRQVLMAHVIHLSSPSCQDLIPVAVVWLRRIPE